MNEEYLWNKTGGDAEIEGLENALKVFSYKQNATPELPAKTFVITEKPGRRVFRLGFALAFAAAFVVVVSVAWFMVPNRKAGVVRDSAKVIAPQPAVIPAVDAPPAPNAELSMQNNIPTIVKARHLARPTAKRTTTVAIQKKDINPAINLTAEEKYAYGQLMLALSITESKLRIVKDTITGNEEMKTVEKGKNLYQK